MNGVVKGKLIDSIGHQNLQDASVTLLQAGDSTLEVFGLAGKDGFFELKGVNVGKFILMVSFSGYANLYRNVSVTKENPVLDIGNLYLKLKSIQLDEVIVQQAPIVIKKDTIEYNAGSFNTKPNAVVEDLLKKLPGIEVARDGSIKAQGEQVQRVLVDGKRFFGDDAKMATKNLPPSIVDKIQVFDAMSDQSQFSGFDDGSRTKTINITTKKDKRKGVFGKAMAGGGDQGRYESSLNLNSFKNGQQYSIIGQANNVNRQAFNVQDLLGAIGRGGGRGGISNALQGLGAGNSSNGITTTQAIGLNQRGSIGKSIENYGSYFFNRISIESVSNSISQRIANNQDSTLFAEQNSNGLSNSNNHRFNYNFEVQLDSFNSLIARPTFTYQTTENNNQTTTSNTLGKITPLNSVFQTNDNFNRGINAGLDATFRHRFKRKGRTYSINLQSTLTNNNSNAWNYSRTDFDALRNRVTDQQNTNAAWSNVGGMTVSYTEPLAKGQLLELSYANNLKASVSNKITNANGPTGYDILVDSLTNRFFNQVNSQRATLGYRLQIGKIALGISNGVQFTELTSQVKSKGIEVQKHFTNLYPTANFSYSRSRSQMFRVNYNGRTNQPSLSQLQPVPDNSDQTNIVVGNPDLTQEFSHTMKMFYNTFDMFRMRHIFMMVNGSITQNKIVSDVAQFVSGPKTGTQKTSYTNLNGAYSLSAYFNYGIQLPKPKSNLNFGVNLSRNRNISLLNSALNRNDASEVGGNIGWTMNLKEKLDLNFSSNTTYNMVRNSLQPQQNQDYYTQVFSVEPTYTFNWGWVLGNDFYYTYNSGRASGYNINVPLWNASLSKLIFKQRNGEIKFSVYDLLNQNQSISRTVSNNTIQDTRTNVLQRYFSLTFTYSLQKFGGKQEKLPPAMHQMFKNGGMKMMRGMMD